MTDTETWLVAALGIVVTISALALSYMIDSHQTRRDQARRARTAARARQRRLRGLTVRPRQ